MSVEQHPSADPGGEQMRSLREAASCKHSPEAMGRPEGGQLLLHDREAVEGYGLHSRLQAVDGERPVRVRLLDMLAPPLDGIPAGVGAITRVAEDEYAWHERWLLARCNVWDCDRQVNRLKGNLLSLHSMQHIIHVATQSKQTESSQILVSL